MPKGAGRPKGAKNKEPTILPPYKRMTPRRQTIQDFYDSAIERANIFNVKRLERTPCSVCGRSRPLVEFWRTYSDDCIAFTDETGDKHCHICKSCAKSLFQDYVKQESGDQIKALNRWCSMMNYYFDLDMAMQAEKEAKTSSSGQDIVSIYLRQLFLSQRLGQVYWDSPFLNDTLPTYYETNEEYYKRVIEDTKMRRVYPPEFENWDKQDLENYDLVIEWYHYDPFTDEQLEDRKKLYQNLVGFSDPEISEDTGKATACIDMCRCLQRLEKLNTMRARIEADDSLSIIDMAKTIKEISALQAKERADIQKYQKEWAFNTRYATGQKQGSGTLTGILKGMDEALFEDALPNAYDIKTSNAMVMAAEASWKGIFSQLNLSEAEFSEIIKHQREDITRLRTELDETKEALRLANVKLKREELEERLKAQQEQESDVG
jgi:hypothetical protein